VESASRSPPAIGTKLWDNGKRVRIAKRSGAQESTRPEERFMARRQEEQEEKDKPKNPPTGRAVTDAKAHARREAGRRGRRKKEGGRSRRAPRPFKAAEGEGASRGRATRPGWDAYKEKIIRP